MSDTTEAEVTETETAASATEGLDDLRAVLTELGLTPAQIRGRLEAGKKNEQRAKENAEKAQRYDALEEANKSEIEKAQQRAEAAEKRLQETELARLRSEVALSKGLTPSQAKRLVGSTAEELEADADELLADLKAARPAAAASSEGQGKQGEAISGVKQITSVDQLSSMSAKEIVEANRSGQLDALKGVTT